MPVIVQSPENSKREVTLISLILIYVLMMYESESESHSVASL